MDAGQRERLLSACFVLPVRKATRKYTVRKGRGQERRGRDLRGKELEYQWLSVKLSALDTDINKIGGPKRSTLQVRHRRGCGSFSGTSLKN